MKADSTISLLGSLIEVGARWSRMSLSDWKRHVANDHHATFLSRMPKFAVNRDLIEKW